MWSDKKTVQDYIMLLVEHNIRHVIITPGSRNAPFSLSLVDHPEIMAHSVIDERSAGFIALGMAQQLNSPVALICTSGTAVLNFAPAIAEAYYQRIPLLITTADRPQEWIDQGEGQSIRQPDVYRNYIKASFDVVLDNGDKDLIWYNARIMDEAMRLCAEGVQGPVHLNFPLRESLYKKSEFSGKFPRRVLQAKMTGNLEENEWKSIRNTVATSKKIMVLAGQRVPDQSLLQAIKQISSNSSVIVFTESHSNLADPDFVTTIDRLLMGLNEDQKVWLVPDLLITIGHNIISRKIKDILRKGEYEHWHVDHSGEGLDTLQHLSKIIALHPSFFFLKLASSNFIQSHYKQTILKWNEKGRYAGNKYVADHGISDLSAFEKILKAIPAGCDLQMGNSSVVRYIQLYDAREDLNYFGNRGVAGIDGCTSTAVGASFSSGRLTAFISGDVAFFYDSNAFWNEMVTARLKIILINNSGGGIFRIIDGPSGTGNALEKFFETAHNRTAESFAAMFNLAHRFARDKNELESGLEWLFQTNHCAILEVTTPRLENDVELKKYFEFIKEQQQTQDI
jgi:2-succinyl-5-enolpyruvyl-6-hydroxy-3-cyclohexene-1-carboxylate synthase